MAQNLQTNIVINARTGNGFSDVGNTLSELSSLVNGISQELINFGVDSTNVYRDYEKSMKDAEVALSTNYGRGTRELASVMEGLDEAATEWAATTIFHTNDVANAISEAAHAGWDYEQIMTGIPAAMRLAQAGSIDLSEAVDFIVKSTNAAGIEFDDTASFIDHWTFAANTSATTIEEMGEAMLKMGRTMQFAGGTDELLVMLAELANAGTVGTTAGTLLRNSMLRLVAPTKKAKDAMASLGAETSEIEEIMNDEALAAANARLAQAGFSAYDEEGNLKSMLDTYADLYVALGNIAGGYDNIASNEDAIDILSSIFPQRSITGALALLQAAGEGYHGLYEYLQNGDAEGYGQYAAETMMDSLNGSIETFESKVERLKQVVGEELSGTIESALTGLGGIVDSIAELDEGNLGALVSGTEVLATAGPALMVASGAFRIIGTLLSSKATAMGLGAIALAALIKTLHELETVDLENQFGTGSLDHAAMTTYLQGVADDFKSAYTEVDAFRQAVDDSIESYNTASQTFTGDLFTAMLTQDELSDEDVVNLQDLAYKMRDVVLDALKNDTEATASFWDVFFGDTSDNPDQGEALSSIMSIENASYQRAVAEAEQIGYGLRDAMNAAFADGHISEEEYQNILSYVESYNEAIARASQEAQEREDTIELKKMIHRAQHASLDELIELGNEIQDTRDEVIADAEDRYLNKRYGLETDAEALIAYYQDIIDNSDNPYVNSALNAEIARIQRESQAAIETADAEWEKQRAEYARPYNEALFRMWDSEIRQSEGLSDPYDYLNELATQVNSQQLSPAAAADLFAAAYGDKEQNQIADITTRWIQNMGGYDEVFSLIGESQSIGDIDSENLLRNVLAMQQIASGLNWMEVEDYDDTVWQFLLGKNWMGSMGNSALEYTDLWKTGGLMTPESAREGFDALREEFSYANDFLNEIGTIFSYDDSQRTAFATTYDQDLKTMLSMMTSNEGVMDQFRNTIQDLKSQYDFEAILADTTSGISSNVTSIYGDYLAAWQLMYGKINSEDYLLEGIDITLDPDTEMLEAAIETEDGQHIRTFIDPDTNELHAAIMDEDGNVLTEYVLGNIDNLREQINSQDGRHIRVYADTVSTGKGHAEGGRATTASIFGEAGPEWAIPEEHSERTAELLDAARAASGFSWGEILARFGGLNANAGHTPTTIVFSPTINATNVEGVDQALRSSEERLIRLLEERELKDSLEVYA